MNTPNNLQLLIAAATAFRDAWDAMASLRINLNIHEDDDDKGDTLEYKVEELAGKLNDGDELTHACLQTVIDAVHAPAEVEHEQQPA